MTTFETTIPLRLTPGSNSLDRQAQLPPHGDVADFGMHGAVAKHYKAAPANPLPTTIDYMAAGVGGCLIGTLAGSLLHARVPVSPERLTGTVTGIVESDEENVLILRKVVMTYTLELDEEFRTAAEEVHEQHARHCPCAQSVSPAIEVLTELNIASPVAA